MKTQIEIIKKGKSVGRTTSMQDPRVRRKLSVALSDYWIKKNQIQNKIQIDHGQQNQRT